MENHLILAIKKQDIYIIVVFIVKILLYLIILL